MAKPSKMPRPGALAPAEQRADREIFRAVRSAGERSAHRARLCEPLHPGGGRGAVGPGHRRLGQQGHRQALQGRRHPQRCWRWAEEGLKPFISSIGLFNTKAKNVIALSRILVEQYGGEVPLNREALMALPGVGRKTASVVLNELRVEPAIAVDTHVFRVSHRLGLSPARRRTRSRPS
jgi:endonuclease-3